MGTLKAIMSLQNIAKESPIVVSIMTTEVNGFFIHGFIDSSTHWWGLKNEIFFGFVTPYINKNVGHHSVAHNKWIQKSYGIWRGLNYLEIAFRRLNSKVFLLLSPICLSGILWKF